MQTRLRSALTRILRLAGLALVVGPIALFAVTRWPPSVSATISGAQRESFRVHVNSNFQVTSLLRLSLWAKGTQGPIWRHELRYRPKTAELALHFGGLADEAQIPQLIETGEEFCLLVTYQYDAAIPPVPHMADDHFWFRVASEGPPQQFHRPDHPQNFFKDP